MSEEHFKKLFKAASLAAGAVSLLLTALLIWDRLSTPEERTYNEGYLLFLLVIDILVYFGFLLFLIYLPPGAPKSITRSKSEFEFNGWFVFGTLLSGMAVVGALIGLAGGRLGLSNAPEIQTGIVIVLAVSVLTLLLFILTLGFRSLGLSNPDQPLALPSGSVRAFIALMLIMIFVILSVYTVRFVGEGLYRYEGLFSLARADELAQAARRDGDNIVRRRVPCPVNPEAPQSIDAPEGGETPVRSENSVCFRVWRVQKLSDDGIRLAQQLTTTVATLVVAVSGFYFGSQTVEKAKDVVAASLGVQMPGVPLIRNIKPNSGKLSETVIATVNGRNLSGVNIVKLVKGQDILEAVNIHSNETSTQCTFMLIDKPLGTWNLVVENAQGQKDELENAFTIITEPHQSGSTEIAPTTTEGETPPSEQTENNPPTS